MERRPGVPVFFHRAARSGFEAYGAGVSIAGALVATALIVTGETVPVGDWRFWLMALLVLAGELIPIDVPRRDGVDRVAISTAFAFAILLLFGLLPGARSPTPPPRRWPTSRARLAPLKVAFNAAPVRARRWPPRRSCSPCSATSRPWRTIGGALRPCLAGAAAFFVVNQVLVGVGVGAARRRAAGPLPVRRPRRSRC